MNSWLSLLPPILAIALAIKTRLVLPSLIAGVFLGVLILANWSFFQAFTNSFELLIQVVSDPDNARLLAFSLLIGSLVFLVQKSGGVAGFVDWASQPHLIDSPRKAGFGAVLMGTLLFIEGSMSILTVGTVARPIFERFKISKEKLAYLADATCAPVAVLIPFNGWGAYLLIQFQKGGIENPVELLISSVPYFFYPLIAYLLAVITALFMWDLGNPMREAEGHERIVNVTELSTQVEGQARFFIVPMLVLIVGLFFFMFITGDGLMIKGDGAKSILYATSLSIVVCYFLYRSSRVFRTAQFVKICLQGMNHLLEVVMILALAFSINQVCRDLQTGAYVARVFEASIPVLAVPAIIFLVSAFIAFATGTSWGTFAIMLGIGLPLAQSLSLPLPIIVGAIVSGGVWGDHCSPISDTTVLSSLASDCPLMDHVRTQMPYALMGGGLTFVSFVVAGLLI